MARVWVMAVGAVAVAGVLGWALQPALAPLDPARSSPVPPAGLPYRAALAPSFADAAAALGSHAIRVVDGGVATATGMARDTPERCAYNLQQQQGVVGWVIPAVTPGAAFTLRAAPNAEVDDIDVVFLRSLTACFSGPDLATPPHSASQGDEAGYVPDDAALAVVHLFTGAGATFRYTEFPPPEPPTATWVTDDAMHFRQSVVHGLSSNYNDLYEPHLAMGGPGALYVTAHTEVFNTLHAPVAVSHDDGLTWSKLPDPEPLPPATSSVPVVGGRLGQGDEGGIAADGQGHAWLYDGAWIAGTSALHSWCDDGARACGFDPVALDVAQATATPCNGAAPRFQDKPWARYGHGQLLLANLGLPDPFVDEFATTPMVGLYDPATGARHWNTCVALGGLEGVPAIRDADGLIAVPQVLRTTEGEGWMAVHTGFDPSTLTASPPLARAHMSWHRCDGVNGFAAFSATGTLYVAAITGPRQFAITASPDLADFATETFDTYGYLRYMWLDGGRLGEGALVSWAVARDCNSVSPVDLYAAHVTLREGRPALEDVSLVAGALAPTCGHYAGNVLGPDGRAYLAMIVSSVCLEGPPQFLPTFHDPLRVFVQDGGPRI